LGECMQRSFFSGIIKSFVLVMLLAISGCSTTPPQVTVARNIITGSITARNLVIFPEQTEVEIILRDDQFSENSETAEPGNTDSAAQNTGGQALKEIISKQIIKNPQVNPIKFSLRYDPADILAFRSYSVSVNVYDKSGILIYRSSRNYPVITGGSPSSVDISLISM
jgi:uncharacterized lipoprotein YbaY